MRIAVASVSGLATVLYSDLVVEVAFDLGDLRAVGDRLGELAERDLPRREEHQGGEAGAGGVGGHRSGRVPGGGASDGAGARGFGHRDPDRHATVLEGARG